MRCPNCGTENTDGVYCSSCGVALPSSELSEAEQQLVRQNETYYARKFAPLRTGRVISWNWAAFFFGPLWMAYRKMKAPALINIFLLSSLFWFGMLWSLPLLMVLQGVLGNWAYYRYVRFWSRECATRPPEQMERAFCRRGGTSPLNAVMVALLLAALWLWWHHFFSTAAVLFSIRG